jgi:hypothetical protein
MTFIIGFWARAGAIMCGVICCCVALFGTVEHGLLPGASAHVVLFLLGTGAIIRALRDDQP